MCWHSTHPFLSRTTDAPRYPPWLSGVPLPRIPKWRGMVCALTTRCWAWRIFPPSLLTLSMMPRCCTGTSSVNETGGGLGGLVRLSTSPANHEGSGCSTCRGVGSFSTFDEFLRLTYGDKHWQSSTRVVYSSSPTTTNTETGTRRKTSMTRDKNIIGSLLPDGTQPQRGL